MGAPRRTTRVVTSAGPSVEAPTYVAATATGCGRSGTVSRTAAPTMASRKPPLMPPPTDQPPGRWPEKRRTASSGPSSGVRARSRSNSAVGEVSVWITDAG